jgi:small conductance mechanosensitive channel
MLDPNKFEFVKDLPEWAQVLLGRPLDIVVILILAELALVIVRLVIRKATQQMIKRPIRPRLGTVADPAYAEARRQARAKTLGSVARSCATVAIWLVALGAILGTLGVNMGVMIASVGVLGVGLGLGAQSLVKDVIAGLFMLVEDQYGIGDTIDIGPATGVVEEMTLRITTLRDADGVLWYVPNGTVARIGNQTQGKQETKQG